MTRLTYVASAGTALVISSVAAIGTTISTSSVITTTELGSTVVSDTVTDGNSSSSAGASFATQNADGTSEVEAATASRGIELVTSTAQFAQSETNTFGTDRDYTLSYDLVGQSAEFNFGFTDAIAFLLRAPNVDGNPFASSDPSLLPAGFTPFSGASFEYNIEVNDALVFSARADALLNGFSPSGGLIFDAVSEFTPSFSSTRSGFNFEVDAISGDIALGTFGDGETLDIVSSLTARAFTPGSNNDTTPVGVNTFSSDPVTLSSVGKLSSVPTPPISAVPLPAAGWLLVAGLGGIAALGRRKS